MDHCHTWKCLYKISLNKKMHGTGQELPTNDNYVKVLTKKSPWNKGTDCGIYLPPHPPFLKKG